MEKCFSKRDAVDTIMDKAEALGEDKGKLWDFIVSYRKKLNKECTEWIENQKKQPKVVWTGTIQE